MSLRTISFALAFGTATLFAASATYARDIQTLVVAGGCFWCVESDFESVAGVSKVVSGYTGVKRTAIMGHRNGCEMQL